MTNKERAQNAERARPVHRAASRARFDLPAVAVGIAWVLLAGTWSGVSLASVEYDFFLVEAFEPDYDLREVMLRDVNESNHVTGTSTNQGFYDGFVWTEATDKVIIPMTWPQGMNNLNQMVGGGQIYSFETGLSISVPPAGTWPVPRLQAINDHQVAVGYSECSCSNSNHTIQEALIWDPQNGSRTIPVPAAKELLRINNGNFAVGNIRGGSAGSEGFLYDADTSTWVNMTDMLPPYMYGRGWSELQDLNEVNVVCGRGWNGEFIRGLTWSDDTGFTFLPPIPGGLIDRVYPRGINTAGTVVGFADLTLHNPRAFVWDATHGMRNLNDLVEAPPNFILDWALKINDAGWIIGVGHYGPGWGTSRGFILAPTALTTATGDPGPTSAPALSILENPVRSQLTVEFSLPEAGSTRVSVFDVAGRTVARIADRPFAAGSHRVSWPAGSTQPAGVYYVRLEAPGFADTRPFVLLR